MKDYSCNNECNSVAKCDIFEFMAKHVGMTVIHPGGFEATNTLLKYLNITSNSKVIDIACGKGTTAMLIAEKYGCNVAAIDIDEKLIEEANYLTKKKGLESKITYYVGDALKLPFNDNEFDVAISQAMLVLVDDKIKAIQEANRVIKKGGAAGWLELSWKKEVTKNFIEKVSTVICAYCMTNVTTFDGWKKTFIDAGINNLNIIPLDFSPTNGGFISMVKDEGFFRTLSIMYNIMKNKEIKNRMKIMNNFFKENSDIFGCGIYYFNK
ncbi:MAG: class I SAM-dependent methyltransferase [Candidatus Thermoplasmatota archaeon]|nr:class I SAM-dependent methyltransferase [Candidatus Thermoplasmatota archaeon]